MRSQALFRRSRSIFKASATRSSVVSHIPRLSRVSRKEQAARPPARVYKRLVSSSPSTSTANDTPTSDDSPANEPPPNEPAEDAEKTKKRTRASAASSPPKDPEDRPQLPAGLDILWIPESESSETDVLQSTALPPPEIFEEALTNLHITLHPQTQHRASYMSSAGPPLEPTLALYCPLEGGDYVIDETVRELARRTGSEVLVIDAVQLAAGEWGHFGKAADALQLPRNPLHFASPASPIQRGPPRTFFENDESDDDIPQMAMPSQMTLHVLTPSSSRGRPPSIMTAARSSVAPSRIKTFFDELINIPSPKSESSGLRKPRLIYIRDFPTLASTSSTWYPPLLSAVRQRRIGPMARPSSPISNPMTIIFGMTPALTPPTSSVSPGSGNAGLVNVLMNRKLSSVTSANVRPGRSDWGEDEAADRAREKRLKDRLKRWEKSDASLIEELPKLSTRSSEGEGNGSSREVVVIGGPSGISGLPPLLSSIMENPERRVLSSATDPDAPNAQYFRTTVLVPNARSTSRERLCRMARRREINEITMRMGVGAIGGILEPFERSDLSAVKEEGEGAASQASRSDDEDMLNDWGNRVEVWSNVRQIADRAVGSVVAAYPRQHDGSLNLEPTSVPWSAVQRAWAAQRSSRDLRKSWMKESTTRLTRDETEENEDGAAELEQEVVDEVVERVKQDPDLDQHEQRLLPCIVDPVSMHTTFSQVHLPSHTIDSVRTIVSLPLLHPTAFQQGILKEHGMTGCLLFGPPGTGKTLVVRALAKEAGCRMMMVSPSDVMDMYVGEGEKLVKAVFSLARKLSPCVVFLDEIDALFGARMSARESGGAFAHRGVITEFMQEMDGLKTSNDDRVIVIGATNRPFDLDDAVLRRLPRRLLVDLPGEKERAEILRILLRDEVLAPDISLGALAKRTETFSGSDLKHLCVAAALDAVKENVSVPWNAPTSSSREPKRIIEAQIIDSSVSTPSLESFGPQELPAVSSEDATNSPSTSSTVSSTPPRILFAHHFTKALKEITPSSSESLGSLADLRRWNEEFGEGRKDKRRQQVWGKGKFGFVDFTTTGKVTEDGQVASIIPPSAASSSSGVVR